jgi:predicted nucleic acid-binding protein
MTIVIDNTVLSNFALIGRIDLLVSAIKDLSPGTTFQVKEEFTIGMEKGLLPKVDLEWLTILELSPK